LPIRFRGFQSGEHAANRSFIPIPDPLAASDPDDRRHARGQGKTQALAGTQVEEKQAELLGKHMIPVVLGPDQRHYVVDHHHLARSLHEEGVKDILVTIIADLTMVDPDAFLGRARQSQVGLSVRRQGRTPALQGHSETVADLKDDPFRKSGRRITPGRGFCKGYDPPFSEFLWGGFPAPQNIHARMWKPISKRRPRKRWLWRKARTRSICRAGADLHLTIKAG